MPKHYLAFDLGAESGRLMVGTLDGDSLSVRELHRFANIPIREGHSLFWNIPNLILECEKGLRKAGSSGLIFESIGVDSWGLDYVLMDEAGGIISPTFHYRDPRTALGMEKTYARISRAEVFKETGIQFMPINSLYQLAAESPDRLQKATLLLGIADGLNHFLCGSTAMDVTNASTFQLCNPVMRDWSTSLINTLDLPRQMFPRLVEPGTMLGRLRPALAQETGLPLIPVIASCSHDTAAAVAGTPVVGENSAYISSGTWSLLGVERRELVLTDQCRELNFTNELGYGGTVRLLKNVSGMWLVQECRRIWKEQGREWSYTELSEFAAKAQPFRTLINPMSSEFLAPSSMPDQLANHCARLGEPIPRTEGETVRSIYESLAFLYRLTLEQIHSLTQSPIRRLHIVGGGSNNTLLNQFTADATNLPVLAGPAEATALGNVLVQAIASGAISNLETGRELIANSHGIKLFKPGEQSLWERNYVRFLDFQ